MPTAAHTVELDLDVNLPGIAAGDPDAFGRWVSGAERPLRLALRSLAAQVDVEAIVQETLLRVWQVAPRVQPGVQSGGRANSLLRLGHRIARNLALDELRRARCEPSDLARIEGALAAAEQLTPVVPDPLLRRVIALCREELPPQPARALAERIATSGSEPDDLLATRAGMTRNTFLQNVTRARRLLAECLERHHVDLGGELR